MTRAIAALRLGAACAMALTLAGCISVLPKSKPASLYRFGQTPVASESVSPSAPGAQVGVFKAGGLFQRESAGDQILTVTDGKVAYIARARWAAPATVLFDQAVQTAFDADPGPAQLVWRGEPVSSRFSMRLDVRNFETHYDQGPKAAPQVVVRLRALIVPATDRDRPVEQVFEAQVRAGDNRVGEIVAAYDRAMGKVLKEMVAWTNAQVAAPL